MLGSIIKSTVITMSLLGQPTECYKSIDTEEIGKNTVTRYSILDEDCDGKADYFTKEVSNFKGKTILFSFKKDTDFNGKIDYSQKIIYGNRTKTQVKNQETGKTIFSSELYNNNLTIDLDDDNKKDYSVRISTNKNNSKISLKEVSKFVKGKTIIVKKGTKEYNLVKLIAEISSSRYDGNIKTLEKLSQ